MDNDELLEYLIMFTQENHRQEFIDWMEGEQERTEEEVDNAIFFFETELG